MDTEIQEFDRDGVPVGCMKGAWLMPFVALAMLLGGIVGAVAIWRWPVLLIPLIGWRVILAVKGYARD